MDNTYYVQARDDLANLKPLKILTYKTRMMAEDTARTLCVAHPYVTVLDSNYKSYKGFRFDAATKQIRSNTRYYNVLPAVVCEMLDG